MSDQSANEEQSSRLGTSILDRPLGSMAAPLYLLGWAAITLATLIVRLPGRTNWPLSSEEARLAHDAVNLLRGNELVSETSAYPGTVELLSMLMFLFGPSDFVVRLLPLLTGIGLIAALIWARRWIGELPAMGIATVWLLSPLVTMSNLRLDAGGMIVLSSLIIVISLIAIAEYPTGLRWAVLGIACALALLVHPLGWISMPIALFAGVVAGRLRTVESSAISGIVAFVATYIVGASWFLTEPEGIYRFPAESMDVLVTDYIAAAGENWLHPLFVLFTDELLSVMLAITGLLLASLGALRTSRINPSIMIGIGTWASLSLVIGTILGNSGQDLYAFALFPITVLAGFGLAMLVNEAIEAGTANGWAILTVLAGIGLIVAIARFTDLLSAGPGNATSEWLISAGVLSLLIALPLAYVMLRGIRATGVAIIPFSLLAVAIVLGSLSLRTSLYLPVTTEERPGAMLAAGSSSPAVTAVTGRINQYSRETTALQRSIQDVTGGHGLTIAIDDAMSEPFAWYFREFPQVEFIQPGEALDPDSSPDVILAEPERADSLRAERGGYTARSYSLERYLPSSIENADVSTVFRWATDPLGYGDFTDYLIHRGSATPAEVEEFVVLVREDHVPGLWGTTSLAE